MRKRDIPATVVAVGITVLFIAAAASPFVLAAFIARSVLYAH